MAPTSVDESCSSSNWWYSCSTSHFSALPGASGIASDHRSFESGEASKLAGLIKISRLLSGEGGVGDSYLKRSWMLVVSLRGINQGFWTHLGCS